LPGVLVPCTTLFVLFFLFDDTLSFKFRVLNGVLGVEELITLLYLFVLNGVFGDLDDLAADKLGDLNEKFNDLVDKAGDLDSTTGDLNVTFNDLVDKAGEFLPE
jgi:hypothetical protein